MKLSFGVSVPIHESPRVLQLQGMFDLQASRLSSQEWQVDLPLEEKPWNIGLITGPSGCGKSSIARHLWPDAYQRAQVWHAHKALVDEFPESLSIKEVCELLSSVGFSSPPAWLRPFHVLSIGQQFRASMARLLAENPALSVVDEFTSTVDRTVAQIGSAALQRTIRKRNQQFIAVTCHEDIIEWLQPDWIYRPAVGEFTWRSLQPRPRISLSIQRCSRKWWKLFAPHHYLSHSLATGATCWLALWQDRPVAFSSWISFLGRGPVARREHRTVTLPDYQGVGIGNALSDTLASMWAGLGYRTLSTTTHPAMIHSRSRSKCWTITRSPCFAPNDEKGMKHAVSRFTCGFKFVGEPMPRAIARALLGRLE